jgi:hypothetical protein
MEYVDRKIADLIQNVWEYFCWNFRTFKFRRLSNTFRKLLLPSIPGAPDASKFYFPILRVDFNQKNSHRLIQRWRTCAVFTGLDLRCGGWIFDFPPRRAVKEWRITDELSRISYAYTAVILTSRLSDFPRVLQENLSVRASSTTIKNSKGS